MLDRTFGVRMVDVSFVGVLGVEELVIFPSGAASKFIASIAAVASPTSEPSPEGIRSSFLRLTVCFAVFSVCGRALKLAPGLIVSKIHSSSSSALLISFNVSS